MSGYFLRLLARAAAGAEAAHASGKEVATSQPIGQPSSPDRVEGLMPSGFLRPASAAEPSHARAPAVAACPAPTDRVDVSNGVARDRSAIPQPTSEQPIGVEPPRSPETPWHAAASAHVGDGAAAVVRGHTPPPAPQVQSAPASALPNAPEFPAPLMVPAVRERPIDSAPASPAVALVAHPPEPVPAVHITIGRVEVIASPPASAAPEPPRTTAHAPLSLDAYLAQRGRRR
jgi:hypothetical protein